MRPIWINLFQYKKQQPKKLFLYYNLIESNRETSFNPLSAKPLSEKSVFCLCKLLTL